MIRSKGRKADQLREVRFTRSYTCHAPGSVLVEFGDTRVLCTAISEDRVPLFRKGSRNGWVTAEYGMLPGSTQTRTRRDTVHHGRAQEIRRLIGRSLRSVVDFAALRERTVTLDCDVLQADGGTRTAAISGAYIALYDAVQHLLKHKVIKENPLHGMVAAVSAGICKGSFLLDLDYSEDNHAEVDINVVMNEARQFIEIQGTAEGNAFRRNDLDALLELTSKGITEIIAAQRSALNL